MNDAVIILDVDGVLSPVPPETLTGWDDWRQADGIVMPMMVSRRMGDTLRALPADIVLLTTWGNEAHRVVTALGWPTTPVVPMVPSRSRWPKIDALRSWLHNNPYPTVVWCDDHLARHRRLVQNLRAEPGSPVTHWCAVSPEPHTGLTPTHLVRIERFLARR